VSWREQGIEMRNWYRKWKRRRVKDHSGKNWDILRIIKLKKYMRSVGV